MDLELWTWQRKDILMSKLSESGIWILVSLPGNADNSPGLLLMCENVFNLSSGIPPSILQLMTLSYSMYRYENQGKFSCMQNVKLVFFAALLPSHSTFPTMNSPQLLLSTICMSLFCSSNFVFNFRHHYPHKAPTLKLTPTACRWSRCNCGLCVQARWTKPLHGYH